MKWGNVGGAEVLEVERGGGSTLATDRCGNYARSQTVIIELIT